MNNFYLTKGKLKDFLRTLWIWAKLVVSHPWRLEAVFAVEVPSNNDRVIHGFNNKWQWSSLVVDAQNVFQIPLRQNFPWRKTRECIPTTRVSHSSDKVWGLRRIETELDLVQRSLLFADNVVLLGFDYLQLSLERFTAKCEAAGVAISTSKSETMILSQKRVECHLWDAMRSCPKHLSVLSRVKEEWRFEIDLQMGMASTVMQTLHWTDVVKKELNPKTKLCLPTQPQTVKKNKWIMKDYKWYKGDRRSLHQW